MKKTEKWIKADVKVLVAGLLTEDKLIKKKRHIRGRNKYIISNRKRRNTKNLVDIKQLFQMMSKAKIKKIMK